MIRKASMIAVLVMLTACAATPKFGTFIEAPTVADKMAADTAAQLVKLYPPASSRLDVLQPANDKFGAALIANLRMSGFAVGDNLAQPGESAPAANPSGIPINYVVDKAGEVFRLSVIAGDSEMSRAYTTKGTTTAAAGAWTVRKLRSSKE